MHVYYLPINSLVWDKIDSQLLKYVSQERREKVLKYVFVHDQKLSLYAELLTRMELSQITKIPATELLFRSTNNLKPLLLSVPAVNFSFSHTRDAILCCISLDGAVGADIEKLESAPFEIMEHVFHPEEIHYVQSSAVRQKDLHFFEIWTRKEAYLKKLGLGLSQNPEAYNTLSPAISADLHTWQQDQYICCVCGKNAASIKLNLLFEEDIRKYFMNKRN